MKLLRWYQGFLERANVKTKQIEVSTSFGESHVLLAGDSSNPPLLCLHSMLTSSAHLVSELRVLTDSFYIIAPDIPGQSVRGLPIRLSFSDKEYSKWLLELIDGVELGETHVLGVSLGGYIAREFASNYPNKVKTLSLIVPAGIVQGSLLKGFIKMALPMIRFKIRPTEKNLRRFTGHLLTTWDEEWAYYLVDAFNGFSSNLKMPPLATDHELESLTMPCLVFGAEHDISFPGKDLIERSNAHIPVVETEFLVGCKHSPPTTPEFREWLRDRITSFVKHQR